MEDENDDRDDTKRRSRNLSEKKRRDQFNSLVNDLSALISTSSRKMDKSTVLKSTIAFLKHHNEATDRSKVFEIQQDWKPSFLSNDEFTQLMLESLDGFIIVFGSRGSIFYTSDSITAQLGYLPCDLTKRTIFDLAYEMDHENLLNVFLNHKPVIEPMQTDISSRNQITFFVHLKRGGIDDRSSGNTYELVKFVGYFRNDANVEGSMQNTQTALPRILQMNAANEIDKKLIFVGTGRLQMPQLIREITVTDPTRNEFTSKHSMEWKFLFLDHRAPPIIGYMPFEVLGTSGYDYYHFDDIDDIVNCHEGLMQSGKGKSGYYRFLTKGQQWIWLQTDFYISYNQFNAKPDYVVCTHKVVNYADVLKNQKKDKQGLLSNTISADKIKSPASVVRDLESSNCHVETSATTPATTSTLTTGNSSSGLCNSVTLLGDIISNETSPSMDTLWTNASTPTGAGTSHINPLKSASRPASSYGNISSTGVSPNVKRKRYPYHYRGNESDSTSMSADSGTSRHSLMTHGRQRLSSSMHQQNVNSSGNQHQHHHQQHSMSMSTHNQLPQVLNHQQQHQQTHHHQQTQQQISMQVNTSTGQQGQQKMLQMLPQHSTATMAGNNSCQFSHPPFPLRNPQIVAPTFLEPPQYLTAIPVQPVIAPFPVAPVISPLPVRIFSSSDNDTGIGSFSSSSSCLLKNQSDMLAGPVIMTPTQSQLQEQLQRKHDELQKLIMQQQDELRIVSEQLLLARYTLLQPMMPVNYNTPVTVGNNTRNYNYNGNTVQPQFNQYGFAMNAGEMQNQQDQQMMMQQQHNLQQQMHQNHAQQQQSAQQLQQTLMQPQHVNHHEQHVQPQTEQLLMNRTVPDLDQFAQEEFDAFLNLSPLHSMEGSQSNMNPLTNINNNNNNSNHLLNQNVTNSANTNNPSVNNTNTLQTTPFSANPNNSEDSLLSYMQMAAEASPALNFPMGISDDGSESQTEDTKLLQNTNTSHHLPGGTGTTQSTVVQPQQRSPSFFPPHNFQNLTVATHNTNVNNSSNSTSTTTNPSNNAADSLPSDLDSILPYPITQDQSQNLFNTNNTQHNAGSSQ
ncbi:circadian locomoter output cycles protein kaput isoform X2 [Lucilia sericata]|uniref:circadian locomoter output cycles protein kaput isoform X2 n=1 Tax=Lucilia sericata TaxID=13632 RepID=UPI0018A85000|nr:circadian locomoter output cycles protein kaput isoform X2 [Lucilia sericata]